MISLIALAMLINSERATPLVVDALLSQRAQIRAEYLCAHNQWSHDGWENSFAGMKSTVKGENLAKNFIDATSTNAALMASPTHRANILKEKYKYVGLGHACGITVELFKK